MPQETKSHQGQSEAASLQGMIASREDEAAFLGALEQAFDYRGDVTLTLESGRAVTGYIFDRRAAGTLAESFVRLLEPTGEQVKVCFNEIARIEFTGRDTAHGKTFENWVKRYVEKKIKGERASIESDPLD